MKRQELDEFIQLCTRLLASTSHVEIEIYNSGVIDQDEAISRLYTLQQAVHNLSGISRGLDEEMLAEEVTSGVPNVQAIARTLGSETDTAAIGAEETEAS
jgi:hypothetical protein